MEKDPAKKTPSFPIFKTTFAPEFQKSRVPAVCKQLQLYLDQAPTLLGHDTSPAKSACNPRTVGAIY